MTEAELAARQSAAQQQVHLSFPSAASTGGRLGAGQGRQQPGRELGAAESARHGHRHTALPAEAVRECLERQSRSNAQLHSGIKHLLPSKIHLGRQRCGGSSGPAVGRRCRRDCCDRTAVTSLPPATPGEVGSVPHL